VRGGRDARAVRHARAARSLQPRRKRAPRVAPAQPPAAHAACTTHGDFALKRRMAVATQIKDIMTRQVHTVRTGAPLLEVACIMRDQRIGDVLVTEDDGTLCGIVTDRDIVVRAVAAGLPLDTTKVSEICSGDLVYVDESASLDDIVAIMREHAIRRVPVVQNEKPVGIVSIGDLARVKDPNSALAEISSAVPNN
jgi:CBS domain-containing protein